MKKLFTVLILLLAGLYALQAQGRHEINLYIGGFNGEYADMETSEEQYLGLSYLYEPQYRVTSGPSLTLDYHFALNKFVKVGAQFDYAKLSGHTYTHISGQQKDFEQNLFYILPQAKIRVPSPKGFRPYGKIAAGVQINSVYSEGHPVKFAWEVVPIGFEWGGQVVYGVAECCLGSVILGGRLGIGCRF